MKSRIITGVGIVLIGLIVWSLVWFDREQAASDPIEEMIDEMPQAPLTASNNDKIRLAFDVFSDYARKHDNNFVSLCKGGFINDENKNLKQISDEIVKNRVLNYHPLEYAATQDEAGITCLSNETHWALFSALNEEDEKAYVCIDSTGRKGAYGIDRDGAKCSFK